MSAVTTRSPACTCSTISRSATLKPCGTRIARMNGDGGVQRSLLATRITGTCVRSAARYRISLMTLGQASASTQICTRCPSRATPARRSWLVTSSELSCASERDGHTALGRIVHGVDEGLDALKGKVEVDETYLGPRRGRRGAANSWSR